MHHGGDYSQCYHPPNPNPSLSYPNPPPIPTEFASAPPYSTNPYPTPNPNHRHPSDFPNYPSPYPLQAPDQAIIMPPSAPSYSPHPQLPLPFPQDPSPYPHQFSQPPFYNPAPISHPSYDSGPAAGYGYGVDEGIGDGVYAYDGGKTEPYGARGIGGFSGPKGLDSGLKFDDYGRSIGGGGGGGSSAGPKEVAAKVVRAVPKMESQQDVKNGVQKFRVKLLPEGASVTTTDVLCQIGLDGIRMLDPSTSRTLRIYPLENVTRWEILDSNIFAFWSKSPVDIEPRRIRLQSNSYTTSTILDIVTAATVQLKEMGGKDSLFRNRGIADASNAPEQTTEKKKGFGDWMNMMKPGNEEKDHWVPDEAVSKCTSCATDFGAFVRKHHCRNCGDIFCDKCTQGRIALTADEQAQPVRVCDRCMAEVSQRLTNAKDSANKTTAIHSHEDLARKLQEEMEKNRKSSSGSKSTDGSGRRMREVACPICTVHLQVQVPTSGSETIECGVCQHPFLVSAH